MNGVIVVNKNKGVTSRDVVNDLMHIFNTKSIGHTGTLDPLATGVLVCTIGKYTKLCDDLMSFKKEYIATMKLGELRSTYDIEGKVLNKSNYIPSKNEIIKVINSYVCEYEQEVPIYSSVKVNGKKLYEYARAGESVILPKKKVKIYSIDDININGLEVKFKVLVSKGTYIRSLINDIGKSLGCYAYMIDLVRTKNGIFNIEDSYSIENIRNNKYKLLSIEDVLDLDIVNVSDKLYKLINNGVSINYTSNKKYILFKYNNENISLYKLLDDNMYHMYIYFK